MKICSLLHHIVCGIPHTSGSARSPRTWLTHL